MTATAFDTLAYANKLKSVGVDSKVAEMQSEATAEILNTLIIEQIATKIDLKDLELKLLFRLGGITIFCTTLIISVLGFILKH